MGAYGSPAVAFAGLLDAASNIVESAIAKEAIAFGAPVWGVLGEENTAYATNAAGRAFLGIAVHVQKGSKTLGADTSKWDVAESVNILSKGRIWVLAEATVNDKDPAYAVTAGAGTVGKFTDVATGNYNINSFFRGNVTDGLALLEVRGMAKAST